MIETQPGPVKKVDRLCSEIQLFDLCDLDKCGHKKSRFCTNEPLLKMFEDIKEEDDSQVLIYDEANLEEDQESEFDEFDEEFESDGDEL